MNVAFLINSLALGGAEGQLTKLALALKAGGWTVEVITLRRQDGYGPALEDAGICVNVLPQGPGMFPALLRLLRRHRPHVLVTFLLRANVLGRLAGRLSGVAVVSSIRNQRFGGASRLGSFVGSWLERLTNPLAAAVVVNSAEAAQDLLRRGVLRPSTTHVVPNVLITPPVVAEQRAAARTMIRSALGFDEHDFVWLAAGRLEPQKNHASLLEAFASLLRRGFHDRLLIVGDGSLREALAAKQAKLGLENSAVRFLGFRRDVAQLMTAADRLVLASRWEGLPNVVIEAMANRLPVVATRVGGVPELIEDGVTGYLAASPEPEEIEAAMVRAREAEPVTLEVIADAALSRVSSLANVEYVADMWRELILTMVRTGGGKP